MAASGDKAVHISLPNALSLFRILLTPVFLYYAYIGQQVIALVVFFLAALSDWADGFLARYLKQESKLGELLDPLADKVLLVASFVGFFFLDKVPLWIMLIAVGRDVFLVLSGIFILLKKFDFRMKPSRLSKINTFLQMLYIASIAFGAPDMISLALGILASVTTVLSAILYIYVFKLWYSCT